MNEQKMKRKSMTDGETETTKTHPTCTVYCILYTVYCILYTVYCNIESVDSIIESVDFIESVDSISRDEQDVPLTQYITNA